MKKLTNNNNNNNSQAKMKSERMRNKFAHIKLYDMLTTRDPIDDETLGIAGSLYSNNIGVEFCQVRKSFYILKNKLPASTLIFRHF